jgi:hypothetical protein
MKIDRNKVLHVILSLAIRAAEWAFATYGDEAEAKIAALVEARYGFDVRPFLDELRKSIAEYEETHPAPAI